MPKLNQAVEKSEEEVMIENAIRDAIKPEPKTGNSERHPGDKTYDGSITDKSVDSGGVDSGDSAGNVSSKGDESDNEGGNNKGGENEEFGVKVSGISKPGDTDRKAIDSDLEKFAGIEKKEQKPESDKQSDPIQKGKDGTPKWAQDRFDQMTAVNKRLKEENEELRKKLETPKSEPLAPDRDDFDTVQEYQKAMSQWNKDITAYNKSIEDSKISSSKMDEIVQESAKAYESQASVLRKQYPDMDEKINKTVYGIAQDAVSYSRHNARIALYLAETPAALEKIKSLPSEREVYRAIGALESKFDALVEKQSTKAPKVLNILEPGGGEVSDVNSMDFANKISRKFLEMD